MAGNSLSAGLKKRIFIVAGAIILLGAPSAYALKSTLHLSPAEKQWLAAHPKIVVGTVPDWDPISMRNKNGGLSGMAVNYKNLIETKLPATFELAPNMPWGQVLDGVRDKRIDMVMPLGQTADRDKYLLFTDVLMEIPYVIITRADAQAVSGVESLAGKRVSVRNRFVSHEWLASKHPEIVLFPRETVEEALGAVVAGEVDAFIGSLPETSATVTKSGFANLKVAADVSFTNRLRIGVRNDWPELVSILNGAIAEISPREHNAIWNLWIRLDRNGIDERTVYAIVGAFVLVIFAGFLIYITSLRRSRARIAKAEGELIRVNRMLTMLIQCNQLLVKELDEETLLRSICRIILDTGGYALAQVSELDTAIPGAKPAMRTVEYRKPVAEMFLTPEVMAECPCITTLGKNESRVIADIGAYIGHDRWRDAALKNGCHAAVFLPLRFSAGHDGLLSIFSESSHSFIPKELELLAELADDLSLGIRTNRNRKEKETAKRLAWKSDRQFRSLVQSASDAIISTDGAGKITLWNSGAQKIFGHGENEALGQNITLIMPERYRAPHSAGLARIAAGGAPKIIGTTVTLEGLRKNGEEFPVELTLAKWEGDEDVNFIAIIRDTSRRKKAEEEVRRNREMLAKAQALAHLGNWEMDLKTGKGTWSDETFRIYGYEPGAFEPSFDVFEKAVHPEDRKTIEEYLQRILRGELSQAELEVRIIGRDGGERVIYDILEVVKDKNGVPVRITGVNFDVTERVEYRRKLEIANEELKAALEQVRQTQAVLMRSEKLAAVGTLSAGVAHEILNPLNIISTICQLLLLDERRGRVHESLNEIILQIQRAAKITNSLRMFAREKKLDITAVDLGALFNHTVGLMERDLNLDNIFIDRRFDPHVPLIMADSDQLAQVFMNLLTNARDVLQPRRSGKITAAAKAVDNGVEFSFCDNGPGMPPDVAARIFDPFYTTKDPGKGTGLGLSVVYRIVEDHAGAISVKTGEGEGTCFTIFLPINGDPRNHSLNAGNPAFKETSA